MNHRSIPQARNAACLTYIATDTTMNDSLQLVRCSFRLRLQFRFFLFRRRKGSLQRCHVSQNLSGVTDNNSTIFISSLAPEPPGLSNHDAKIQHTRIIESLWERIGHVL